MPVALSIVEKRLSREATESVVEGTATREYIVGGATEGTANFVGSGDTVDESTTVTITGTAYLGDTTVFSPIIDGIPSTAGIAVGYFVTGPGIQAGAYVVSVDSGTQITISSNATATAAAVALSISPPAFGLYIGCPISGAGIQPGSTIFSVDSGTTFSLSLPATATAAGVVLTVSLTEDVLVRVLVEDTIPAYYLGRPLKNYTIAPKGNGWWDVKVSYARRSGEKKFHFSTGGGKHKMLQSYGSAYYPGITPTVLAVTCATVSGSNILTCSTPGGFVGIALQAAITGAGIPAGAKVNSVPDNGTTLVMSVPANLDSPTTSITFTWSKGIDFKQAINVGEKNVPEGVEVGIPEFNFTLSRTFPNPLNGTYALALYEKSWHVNSDGVTLNVQGLTYVFAIGELLYQYAEGGLTGTDDFEVTLHFQSHLNTSGRFFDTIGPVQKKGHEYLWVKYEKFNDPNGLMILKPKQVCVEQVYLTTPLSMLFA